MTHHYDFKRSQTTSLFSDFQNNRFPEHTTSTALIKLILLLSVTFICGALTAYPQSTSTYYATPTTPNGFSSSRVFRQEIARLEVTVSRDGKPPRIALKISGVTSVAYPIFRTISFQ